jgi:hypothetical protein
MNSDSEDNWLDAAQIACPSCSAALFRVNHSPYCDDWRLHCDSCPIAIEVSFYDAHVAELRTQAGDDHAALLDSISRDLAPCACGGTFHYAAARRCFNCKSVVVTDAGVDLTPFTGCELTGDDPSNAQQEMYDNYESEFLIQAAIWGCRGV